MNKKLNIAIGSDAFPPTTDGISNVVQNYASVINKQLGSATVITPKNPNQRDKEYPYDIYRYKSWWAPTKGGYSIGWPFKESLHNDIVNMNFDVLHSHCPLATSYYFRRVNMVKRIPTILTYHTKYEYDIDRCIPVKAVRDFAYDFIANNINAADEVWLTSKGSEDSIRKFGFEGETVVMPNGCDLPIADIDDSITDKLKDELNIPKDIPVFIYVGRMIWYKNLNLVFDACKILKDRCEDFRIVLIGFGADEPEIRRYYKKAGISDKVIFVGKLLDRNELQTYYSMSDMLLFPSIFDTNGLVVREAASCKTPSLLVRDSCAAEGITDGETGFLCMESAHSIAVTLQQVMHKKDLLKRVGSLAQKEIYISWDDAVKNAYERYSIVIDKFNSKMK